MEQVNHYSTAILAWATDFAPHLIGAIIVLIAGRYLIKWLANMAEVSLKKQKINVSLQTFFISIFSIGLEILLLITVAGMVGIQTTSFVAIIGAIGLAVGLALQGSLGNFAGGVLILIFKPFKVGDRIESQGQSGLVLEIQIFNTVLLTPDNRTVILANGAVSNNTVINFSKHGSLRADITMTVEIDNDIELVRKVIIEACYSHPKVFKLPETTVHVSKINEGNVTLTICPYTHADDYWDVYFGVQEGIKLGFEKNNIKFPEPHLFITQLPAQ